jgi:ADP-ribosylglycohydrolase
VISIENRVRAGLWGHLVADALGVPHEFKAPVTERVAMVMPPEYKKSWSKVPYGTWSDDGALTLALAASLAERQIVDLDDIGARMVQWYAKGEYTPDGKSYDTGKTTREAILRMMSGRVATKAGCAQESSNGNGSLMRVLPLAFFLNGSDDELFQAAEAVSAITHAHPWSTTACGIYTVTARALARGESGAKALVRGYQTANCLGKARLRMPTTASGSGFVLDTLIYAVLKLHERLDYETTVRQAISLGSDTDTTAAISGALAATRDGPDSIPAEWMQHLKGKNVAGAIIDRFVIASPLLQATTRSPT